MRLRKVIVKFFAVCAVGLCCCIDPYNPSDISGNANALVVEAFLNATENTCSVKLSRTIPLQGSGIQYESGAMVTLQDNMGAQYALAETNNGEFLIDNLTLSANAKYQLNITTQDGEEYVSDAVPIYKAASLDSVTWNETRNGVALNVTAHSETPNTGYYYWRFVETWAYNSAFNSILITDGDTVRYRNMDEAVYRCYMTENSSSILVGSSDKLAEDVIQNFNLTTVPWLSPKISIRYSILVEQRTIDLKAYEYWQQLRKNTEELGTIFDPLPFLPLSNIHCVTSPDKIALGYFNASETLQKRIFILRSKIDFPGIVKPITGYENCELIIRFFGEDFGSNLPIQFEFRSAGGGPPAPVGFQVATPRCVDCRLLGGSTLTPAFWE